MSFFKKSVLTVCLVLLLLTAFVVPSFADTVTGTPLTGKLQFALHDKVNFAYACTVTQGSTSTNSWIKSTYGGSNLTLLLYIDTSNLGLMSGESYTFTCPDVWNRSTGVSQTSYATCKFSVGISDGYIHDNSLPNDVNYFYVTNLEQSSHGASLKFTFSVPSNYTAPTLFLQISWLDHSPTNAHIQMGLITLEYVNKVDTGSWVGPDLEITDIDISNDISNIGTSGGSLITFLQTGFSRVRVGVIGVASLFTSCWDYLTTYTPELTYIIVFGLVLGLLGMLISIFKFGKESGNTGKSSSSKSDKGGGSS